MPDCRFHLSAEGISRALDELGRRDGDIAAAVERVGIPGERRGSSGFETFMRIIVGQQLSTKAATTIYARVEAVCGGTVTPDTFLALADDRLRAAGLSRQKIVYARGLAEAVATGAFAPEALAAMDDEAAIATITALKGFGAWSAQMYLMFSLGRPDIWPVDDLGVQGGVQRIKGLEARPRPKALIELGEAWRPYRSSVALLAWHYHSNAPL